jgi:hypothetical protein
VELLKRIVRKRLPEPRIRWLASTYEIGDGYRRIYHFHVRKTAGTSLDAAFWNLANLDLLDFEKKTYTCKNGLIIVRGHKKRIEDGHYFYASSHIPAHELRLPGRTFTLVMLRDPLARVLSHYRYLLWRLNDPDAEAREPFFDELEPELPWLGESFGDFLDRVPREHLLRQLYMFSDSYDVDEAVERIAACSAVGFTEAFAESLEEIARRLDLPLSVRSERRFQYPVHPTDTELARARVLLEPEIELLARVTELRGSGGGKRERSTSSWGAGTSRSPSRST